MEWSNYWTSLLGKEKLRNKVIEMNQIDEEKNGGCQIEEICHRIYDEYKDYREELERVRQDLLKKIETFPGVHLQTSRVKSLDSVLKKVIKKRHKHLLDESNQYASITGENYRDILTDLIGIRLILSYRGKWMDLHQKMIQEFPYCTDMDMYDICHFIPHPPDGKSVIAEIPKAYHAYKDDVTIYEKAGIKPILKDNGYRSVHYVVSFEGVYVEIQMRTIYDEAWSNCDHSYVYKNEGHKSYAALKELSKILCLLTNAANDMGEKMREICVEEILWEQDGKYQLKKESDLNMEKISDKIRDAGQLFDEFKERLM